MSSGLAGGVWEWSIDSALSGPSKLNCRFPPTTPRPISTPYTGTPLPLPTFTIPPIGALPTPSVAPGPPCSIKPSNSFTLSGSAYQPAQCLFLSATGPCASTGSFDLSLQLKSGKFTPTPTPTP